MTVSEHRNMYIYSLNYYMVGDKNARQVWFALGTLTETS